MAQRRRTRAPRVRLVGATSTVRGWSVADTLGSLHGLSSALSGAHAAPAARREALHGVVCCAFLEHAAVSELTPNDVLASRRAAARVVFSEYCVDRTSRERNAIVRNCEKPGCPNCESLQRLVLHLIPHPPRSPPLHAFPPRRTATPVCCMQCSDAYCPPPATSASCVPCSSTAPLAMTAMQSASRMVESRWAMMMEVRPPAAMSLSSAAWTTRSDSLSSALVASSSNRMRGLRRIARAMAMLRAEGSAS